MKKKYLFVVNNLNIGGPQKSLLSLLHYFPNDIEVDVITLNGKKELEKYLSNRIKVIDVPSEIKLLMIDKNGIFKNILMNIFKYPSLSINVIKILFCKVFNRKSLTQNKQAFWNENQNQLKHNPLKKYDVAIGVSGGHSIMYISDFINARKKVGWIRTEYQNLNRNLYIDSLYFNKMNNILSVSDKCTEKFIEFFPQEKNKIKTFYNPLPFKMYEAIEEDTETNRSNIYKENTNRIKLVTISRLDKDKGFEFLIEAARLLKKDGMDFEWSIYGIGPIEKYLQKNIKKYHLENQVILKGFKFNTGEALKKADMLVHPSRFEGKSNTIDEAKFYELPIVCTNFPTVGEQIQNNINGLISEMNGNSLKDKIIELINDENKRQTLVENLHREKDNSRNVFNEFQEKIGE